jgi:hypothetical protein
MILSNFKGNASPEIGGFPQKIHCCSVYMNKPSSVFSADFAKFASFTSAFSNGSWVPPIFGFSSNDYGGKLLLIYRYFYTKINLLFFQLFLHVH